jgi:hypothetical protein
MPEQIGFSWRAELRDIWTSIRAIFLPNSYIRSPISGLEKIKKNPGQLPNSIKAFSTFYVG